MFAVLINKVSLQVTVEAVFGGSVVLPCSSAEHDLKLQDVDVFWRHNGSKIVFDIIKGEDSLENQGQWYKNRAETFPEEYVRGNFSIKLSGLTHADAGKYICLITPSDEQETVELIINEKRSQAALCHVNMAWVQTLMSCSFVCIFAVLINKVCLQVTVEAVFGGSVVLPCSSAEHDLKRLDTEVHWRHNGSKIVFDIIKGEVSLENQGQWYKNRAETFPEEYVRGNFSIKLSGLTHADAGQYICLITPSDEQETVELIINDLFVAETTTEKGNKTTDQENQETRPDRVEKSWLWILVVILLTIILGLLFFLIIFRKKIPSCLMSGEHGLGSDAHEVVSPVPCYE
ncbi:hypothetical protein G5714_021856 [Onychostoma macrolepis]|uniref:Ig-like domain-containing protein n=1 Tax=Onychostoma macrolepis TaxID=369639 RepID=A0A7J6BS89_9TELE|nr:hypothetical protein G5714_021856 [Onychostoma macrolepis]